MNNALLNFSTEKPLRAFVIFEGRREPKKIMGISMKWGMKGPAKSIQI